MISQPHTTKQTPINCTDPVWDAEKQCYTWTETIACETSEEFMQEYKNQFLNELSNYDTLTTETISALKAKAQAEVDWVGVGEATK